MTALSVEDLWNKVRTCFDTDDGLLPGIVIGGLTVDGVSRIYRTLRNRSQLTSAAPECWVESQQASVSIDSLPGAAEMVATEKAEPFHHCVSGLRVGDVVLPVLGVFVFPTDIEIDYRMGPEWGQREGHAFFLLLRELIRCEPGAWVRPAEFEGPPDPEAFQKAWDRFSDGE